MQKTEIKSILVSNELNEFPIQIPLESDGTLLISTLWNFVPGVKNLKYLKSNTQWESLHVINNRIYPPSEGWKENIYYCEPDAFYNDECELERMEKSLCPIFEEDGYCEKQVEGKCQLIHGDYCEICHHYSLNPFSESQRETHLKNCCEECFKENSKNKDNYDDLESLLLCPIYEKNGICQENLQGICEMIHGDFCDICNQHSLHPFSEVKRENHLKSCLENVDRICGICFDVIYNRTRFGLLENCAHVYCLECIQEWRSLRLNSHKRCPQCRIVSDIIIPSNYFIEDRFKKKELIAQLNLRCQ